MKEKSSIQVSSCEVHGRFKVQYQYCPFCGDKLVIKKMVPKKVLLEPYKCKGNECEFYNPPRYGRQELSSYCIEDGTCKKYIYCYGDEKHPRVYGKMALCRDYGEDINKILKGETVVYEGQINSIKNV